MVSKSTHLQRLFIYRGIKEIGIKLDTTSKIYSISRQSPHESLRTFVLIILMFVSYIYKSTVYISKHKILHYSTIQLAQSLCSQRNTYVHVTEKKGHNHAMICTYLNSTEANCLHYVCRVCPA